MSFLVKKVAVFIFLIVSLSIFAHLLKMIFYFIVPFIVILVAYISNSIDVDASHYIALLDSVSISLSYLIIGYLSEYFTILADEKEIRLDENDNPVILKKIPPYFLSFMCSLLGIAYIYVVNEHLSTIIILSLLLFFASFLGSKLFLIIKKNKKDKIQNE